MKHLPRVGLLMSFAVALGGCPIWGSGSGDSSSSNCYGQQCVQTGGPCSSDFDCPTNQYCAGQDGHCHPYPTGTGGSGSTTISTTGTGTTGATTTSGTTTASSTSTGSAPVYCGNPADCGAGQTCGPDGTCHTGDCSKVGCIYGYVCDTTMTPATCKAENPAACGGDSDCASAGTGYRCVNGVCTAPSDQCFDGTQCASGDVCANGKCTPSCTSNSNCPSDYTCATTVGTCTVPATACTKTSDCMSASEVCVAGACVPRSTGNGQCPTGTVWVENGCIPDQHATFFCNVDGMQDACAGGSVCLHHACYISCDAPNQNACTGLPTFNQCKPVTTTSGSHDVCGSSSNLGSDCNPTAGVGCQPGHICVDGYCK